MCVLKKKIKKNSWLCCGLYQIFKEEISTYTIEYYIHKKICLITFKVFEKSVKTYFSTQNSSIFSSPFISSLENLNSFTTSPQTYQYHPIHYNSVNILPQPFSYANQNVIIDNNKAVRSAFINRNLNNYCGYCLPTNTSLVSFETPLPRHQQETLITGSKRVELKSLYVECEKNVNYFFGQYPLINRSYKESVANKIVSSSLNQTKKSLINTIMVSICCPNSWAHFLEKKYSEKFILKLAGSRHNVQAYLLYENCLYYRFKMLSSLIFLLYMLMKMKIENYFKHVQIHTCDMIIVLRFNYWNTEN